MEYGNFKKFGFIQSEIDRCLYYKFVDGGLLIVLLYVDDIMGFNTKTAVLVRKLPLNLEGVHDQDL